MADIQQPELVAIAKAHGVRQVVRCGGPLTDEKMAVLATVDKNARLIKGQVFFWLGGIDWHDR